MRRFMDAGNHVGKYVCATNAGITLRADLEEKKRVFSLRKYFSDNLNPIQPISPWNKNL